MSSGPMGRMTVTDSFSLLELSEAETPKTTWTLLVTEVVMRGGELGVLIRENIKLELEQKQMIRATTESKAIFELVVVVVARNQPLS
jgi:hypothetical protein